jgi:hemolysin activation/secretion protein
MMKPTLQAQYRLNKQIGLASTLLLTGAFMATAMVPAAQAQFLPNQANPGVLSQPKDDNPNIEKKSNQGKIESTKDPDSVNFDVEKPKPQVGVQQQQFFVQKIAVEGSTLIEASELQPIITPYEGRQVTLEELQGLVEKINTKYQDKGFVTSQAYIPPQDIQSGNVTINVLEGTVGKVEITGNKYYKAWAVQRDVAAEPGTLFNIHNLETALNRINNQSNFRLKATLSPGEQTGQTDVLVEVAERQPWQITPFFDNQGRPFIGTMRWGTTVSNQNLTGIGDRLTLNWTGAGGKRPGMTQIGSGSYFVPVNKNGGELGATFAYSFVDVDLQNPAGQSEITGHAYNYGLIYSQPFDEERTFTGDVGLNIRRITSYFDDVKTNPSTDILAFQAGLNFNKFDRLGRTFARTSVSLAPPWWGANTDFVKFEGYLTRIFKLPKSNLLILRGYSQLTANDLPTAEQMQIGGANTVRGYSEGLLIGDRGFNFTVEHRWPIPFLRAASPWLADRLQGVSFFDLGWVGIDRRSATFVPGVSNTGLRQFLMGTGFGLRYRLTQYLQGFVDCGFGLTDAGKIEPNAQPVARVHFGIRSDLLPDTLKVHDTGRVPLYSNTKSTSSKNPSDMPELAPAQPNDSGASSMSTPGANKRIEFGT